MIVSCAALIINFRGGLRITDGSVRILARFNNRVVVANIGATPIVFLVSTNETFGFLFSD
jgi:hypothetical protein